MGEVAVGVLPMGELQAVGLWPSVRDGCGALGCFGVGILNSSNPPSQSGVS